MQILFATYFYTYFESSHFVGVFYSHLYGHPYFYFSGTLWVAALCFHLLGHIYSLLCQSFVCHLVNSFVKITPRQPHGPVFCIWVTKTQLTTHCSTWQVSQSVSYVWLWQLDTQLPFLFQFFAPKQKDKSIVYFSSLNYFPWCQMLSVVGGAAASSPDQSTPREKHGSSIV